MKRVFALVLALVMCLGLGACNNTGTEETPSTSPSTSVSAGQQGSTVEGDSNFVRQTEEGTLTVGMMTAVSGFDTVGDSNYLGMKLVYETLFYVNPDDPTPQGLLAEKWEYQDDTHLYIKLYDDATFSNGEPVTCEDVIWSWYRTVEQQGSEMQNLEFIDFENTEIINDKEMVLAYNFPFSPALGFMSMTTWGAVLCKSAMENATADDYWDSPVGSGPYTVVENVSGVGTTYALREDYWNPATMPEAETIYVRNYSDTNTMFIDYETGALDMAFDIDPTDAARVVNGEVADTSYEIISENDITSLAFPEYMEVFDDINVRKALSLATDVDALTEIGYGVLGQVASSNLPSGISYALETGKNEYDPEEAKRLLEEAGYKDGDLSFLVVVVTDPELDRLATVLQEQWAAIGVELEILSVDLATAIPYYMAGDTDVIFNQGGGVGSYDPYEVLQMSMEQSSNATIRITDATFNQYCRTGMSSTDEAVAQEAYENAQQWLADNYRMIPIVEMSSCVVYRPYIKDVVTDGGHEITIRWVDFT